MKKNVKLILGVVVLLVIVAAIVGATVYFLKNRARDSGPQTENSLGEYDCLAKFRVKSNVAYSGGAQILATDFFQSFASGAFFGKINNYQPQTNRQFGGFINQLMQEQKVKTYAHLWADVCLYREDLFNPKDGATLYYYIQHYYCTNRCQTGQYDLRVDLDADGNFAGYRQGDIF